MASFVPSTTAYCVERAIDGIQVVSIEDVGPVLRNPIFRDGSDGEGSARQRVVSILRGFQLRVSIPPVAVVEARAEYQHRYKLVHGAHRFYRSLAAGFTHVPTVKGFDINEPDN